MRIALHAGVHGTDNDILLNLLLRNGPQLQAQHVAAPHSSKYRKSLREIMIKMSRHKPSPEARDILLDLILENEGDDIEHVILSNSNFFGAPKESFQNNLMYPSALTHLAKFNYLFAPDQVELFIAIKNPITHVADMFAASSCETIEELLNGSDLTALHWYPLVKTLRTQLPDMKITLWCNEDMPFLLRQILTAFGNLPLDHPIEGEYSVFETLLSETGKQRFGTYIAAHPNITPKQKQKVMFAFADRFPNLERSEQEIDIPNVTQDLIEEITDLYDSDVEDILSLEGVRVLLPGA